MNLRELSEYPPWEWPEEAQEIILTTLKDTASDPADRRVAVDLASSVAVADESTVDSLLDIVRNGKESEELRGCAAVALGPTLQFSDEYDYDGWEPEEEIISEDTFHVLQEELQRMYSDEQVPLHVRRKILEASVRAPRNWHADAVRENYSSGDPQRLLTAVFCMNYIEGFDKEILEALDSSDPKVRFEAVRAAGSQGVTEAWFHVSRLARSDRTDKGLRLAAIAALSELLPEKSTDILESLVESPDADVSSVAEEALSMANLELGFDEMGDSYLEEDEEDLLGDFEDYEADDEDDDKDDDILF